MKQDRMAELKESNRISEVCMLWGKFLVVAVVEKLKTGLPGLSCRP
jgi:hypothetical protein